MSDVTPTIDVIPMTMPTTVRADRILLDHNVSHAIVTISLKRAQRIGYSRLRASIGSSDAARIAGYRPKNSPTAAVIVVPRATDQASTAAGRGVSMLIT